MERYSWYIAKQQMLIIEHYVSVYSYTLLYIIMWSNRYQSITIQIKDQQTDTCRLNLACCLFFWVFSITCAAAAAAKSLQSCLTLCDPIDGSPPGSPVPGILQARTLEWVAIITCTDGYFPAITANLAQVETETVWPKSPLCLLSGALQKKVCWLLF